MPEANWDVFDQEIQDLCYSNHAKHQNNINSQQLHIECEEILQLAAAANEYIDRMAPWTLKKTDPKKMAHVLYALMEVIRCISIYLQPFAPHSASKFLDFMNIPETDRHFNNLNKENSLKSGAEINKPEVVFPRIEADKIAC